MFHPVKKEVSNKTIRLPDTLLEKMELLAVQKDVSFYQIVVQCCEYAIFPFCQPRRINLWPDRAPII